MNINEMCMFIKRISFLMQNDRNLSFLLLLIKYDYNNIN